MAPKAFTVHPVAALFPDMPPADFAALVEDIRRNGLKTPVLVQGEKILDGRHRYLACKELGIRCPTVNWNGHSPWLEVQSRNLLRRHLSSEQICAIQRLARERFPELAVPIEAAKARAQQRKAQAKGESRGKKALSGSQDRQRQSADEIGALMGVSGSTVKRVDRLARRAPELLPRVAAGELSLRKALRELVEHGHGRAVTPKQNSFSLEHALARLERTVAAEWEKCPQEHGMQFLRALHQLLKRLYYSHKSTKSAHSAA